MIFRIIFFLLVLLCAGTVISSDCRSAYAEQKEAEKTININLPLPVCTKSKISFWLIENQIQSANDLVFQLKGCTLKDDFVVCGFEVTNCGDKPGWFYVDSSSSFYGSSDAAYELKKKTIAGRSSGPDGMAKTFLDKGQTETGHLTFHWSGSDKPGYTLALILTGGKWAGEMHKAIFKNIKLKK
ncbi:MAG: hypothetical protein RBT37_03990 [Dissulfurispiraceae bacterium]|nr:hypothetical protein [Dissulfurispiraceae bacterium]